MPPRVKITGSYGYQGAKKISYADVIRGALGFAFVVSGVSAVTTQYMARVMNYVSLLGEPLFVLLGTPYYSPLRAWMWLPQLLRYDGITEFTLASTGLLSAGVITGGIILVLNLLAQSRGTLSDVHGSARWATEQDIIDAGLFPRPGEPPSEISVYTGAWSQTIGGFFKRTILRYLIHGGPEHILAFAPTRSGKGVGLVIPSLLRWADSVLVYDIKGENFALTGGWREKELGSIVIKLDPTDPNAYDKGTSGTFNPLAEIPLDWDCKGEYKAGEWPPLERGDVAGETAAVQNLVSMIVDPEGKGLEDHWAKTSHSLLVGCVTHLLYKAKKDGIIYTEGTKRKKRWVPCLGDVAEELSKPGKPWKDVIQSWQKFPHLGIRDGQPLVHPVVNVAAQEMLNRDDREASSVLSTAISFLTLYRDDVIAKNTSRSSFKISDLMDSEKPVSLYFVVKPVDKDRIKPFVRLFLTQVIRRLADNMTFENGEQKQIHTHRLLLMLDEFPSLGRLQIFEEALAFIAGYGLKAYLIIQDIAQLHKIYGREEAITGNCHVKIAYATSNPDTAKYLSEASGTTTIIKEADSISGDPTSLKRSFSRSVQEISRPLLTVDECMRLRGAEKDATGKILVPGDMLIFVAGYAGIYGKQLLYFRDPELSRRAKLPPPEVSGRTASGDEKMDDRAWVEEAVMHTDYSNPKSPSRDDIYDFYNNGCIKGPITYHKNGKQKQQAGVELGKK